MKVVIFCGGFGVRMGEETQRIPKPMIRIGDRPILWHIMRYYASWGHNEFILCLGYRSEVVKEYFLNHDEALTNDFVLEGNGRGAQVEAAHPRGRRLAHHICRYRNQLHDRRASQGRAVYLGDDEAFLATYGDGLTDAPLPDVIRRFHEKDKMAIFLSVPPTFTTHIIAADDDGTVTGIQEMGSSDCQDQRRLLRPQARDSRLDRARRRARRGDLRAVDPEGGDLRLSLRGLLRAHGHDQGSAAARGAARERARTVGSQHA